jgi:hypothetical protein
MTLVHLTWGPIHGADSYQLMVYDRTDAQVVLTETVLSTAHSVQIPDERCNHDLSMRVRALRGDAWDDWTEFEPLPLAFLLGERRDVQPPLSEDETPGLLFMFTIDTECSVLRQPNPDPRRVVDELIFGDFGNSGRPGGIGLQMDLLEHFGFRGCFFVDVLMEFEHGQAALERTIEAISERGHEVELHVHAEHLEWAADPRTRRLAVELSKGGAGERDAFRRLIELSSDLFELRVGRRPVAYRAGGYRIADMHFPVLEEFGIGIDSSVQPYFNSRVSDWMRTRTQPFRVGGVLEIPPTLVLLNDRPDAWEIRGFTPNSQLGDPVSTLPVVPGSPPHVATFVSHSFQLLRCRESHDKDVIDAFAERLRLGLFSEVSDRRWSGEIVRTFGEELDDGLVAAVAGILRRVADRPDARCVTYADIATMRDRFWPSERHPPVDAIPLLDRPRGIATATGTRIFSRDLLLHLAAKETVQLTNGGDGGGTWVEGLEHGGVAEFGDRLDVLVAELVSGDPLCLRLRTLGVLAPGRRGALPPLAELLFSADDLRAVAEEVESEEPVAIPWDGATFRAWLERRGFEIVSERRVTRSDKDLLALSSFREKLKWLDPIELRTEALEFELRPARAEVVDIWPSDPRLIELCGDESTAMATIPAGIDPVLLPTIAANLYESLYPGRELQLRIADNTELVSRTTSLLALMRTGLEVLDRNGSVYRFIRPVDLPDIRRFAGVG